MRYIILRNNLGIAGLEVVTHTYFEATLFSQEWCWRGEQSQEVVKEGLAVFPLEPVFQGRVANTDSPGLGRAWAFLSSHEPLHTVGQQGASSGHQCSPILPSFFLFFLFVSGWPTVLVLKVWSKDSGRAQDLFGGFVRPTLFS